MFSQDFRGLHGFLKQSVRVAGSLGWKSRNLHFSFCSASSRDLEQVTDLYWVIFFLFALLLSQGISYIKWNNAYGNTSQIVKGHVNMWQTLKRYFAWLINRTTCKFALRLQLSNLKLCSSENPLFQSLMIRNNFEYECPK